MGKVDPHEGRHMQRYLYIFLGAGCAGMLVAALVARGLGWVGMGGAVLFLPWLVGGIIMVPLAFHKGVEFGASRGSDPRR